MDPRPDLRPVLLGMDRKIAMISLNMPEQFNALSEPLLEELAKALEICMNDNNIRVVIIKGEGRAFCAGGDLQAMKQGLDENDPQRMTRLMRAVSKVARLLRAIRKPIIAAVHGSAAGAGCSMALLCDFRVASKEVRFIESFVNVGLIPDMGGTLALSRFIGVGRVTEYLMTGKPMTAEEAYEFGIVNAVTEPADLLKEAIALAQKLVAMPAKAISHIKDLINQTLFSDFDAALDKEIRYQLLLSKTDDHREGVEAFLEKRPPVFNKS